MARGRGGVMTKPGKHGTLYRFVIRYTPDPELEPRGFEWFTWAYDRDHACEKWLDSNAVEAFDVVEEPKLVRVSKAAR